MKSFLKSFRIGKSGGEALGPLEGVIMEVLWKKGGLTGREVYKEVLRAKKVAYTTVLTVLERLVNKGLVKKEKGEEGYIFSALYSKGEFEGFVAREVLKGVLELSQSTAIVNFVDLLAEEDPKELERLKRLVEEKSRELGKKD
ncbi:MAG TPA: hypothetical protein ENK42_03720 [Deltaproteobacteria bacterium]|nr:hypothetical protein [Deltaproteobacteria bacterium]